MPIWWPSANSSRNSAGVNFRLSGRPEQQHSERLFFCLQADGDNAPQILLERQMPESANRFFFFQRAERIVAQVAEAKQSAQAGDQPDEIIVQTFLLHGSAKLIVESYGDHRSRPLRIALVKKQRTGRQAHDAQHTVQRLREHAVNLATDKT